MQVRVHVVRDRGWRICDDAVPGVTEELSRNRRLQGLALTYVSLHVNVCGRRKSFP